MRQSSGNGRWALKGLGGLGAAILVAAACAGGDTPPRNRDLQIAILEKYSPEDLVGVAQGGSGGAGSGGGQGGSAATNAGSGGGAGSGSMPAGGSSGGGSAGSGSGEFCDAPGTILVAKCGGAGCHGDGSAQGAFATDEAAALMFVDKVSEAQGAACGLYIDSANPEDSIILTMVTGEASGCSPLPMPLTGDPLTPAEEDCLSDWLSQF